MSKRAIITGANGFIGSWLCKELTENDYQVIAVVRNKHSNISTIENLKNIDIVHCNMYAIHKLPKLVQENCDYFFHFAWDGTAGDERGDFEVQLSNIEATCAAVNTAKECNCKRFIHAGSLMEYEAINYLTQNNSQPGVGYIYKTAKLAADFMAKTLAQQCGIEYVNAVISNTYGIGEISLRFISAFMRVMLKENECNLTSCEQLYDFIYISDAVRAIRLVAEKGLPYTNYYIGNQEQHKLKDYVIKMRDIVNSKVKLNFGVVPFDGIDLDYRTLETQRLYTELNFIPEVSFETGITGTLKWLQGIIK